jgi:CO/xanthine dehydrogenase Mo-binding subunit
MGVRGVGEAGLVPTATANAVESVTGARITTLPIMTERILTVSTAQRQQTSGKRVLQLNS